jgi:hypothetical protein
MLKRTIKQSDSLVFLSRPSTIEGGAGVGGDWECRAGVYDMAGVEQVPVFDVTAKYIHSDGEEYFAVVVAPAMTAPLLAGSYQLAIEIKNESVEPAFEQETHIPFDVVAQLIS